MIATKPRVKGERKPKSYPRCDMCGAEWHGFEKAGCPGPFGLRESNAPANKEKN
jgi:hypothetical protein